MKYRAYQPRSRFFTRKLLAILLILLAVTVGATIAVRHYYFENLQPVNAASTKAVHVTIATGSTLDQISKQLKTANLIRSDQVFQWYVSGHNERDKLQAGTYKFSQSQSLPEIVDALVHGKVASDLVTILPGARLDQIRQTFIKSGFAAADVDASLQADQYRTNFPALADNPAGASLEGFLYPDSYQKDASTRPEQIVKEALNEMQSHLTTDIRKGFVAQGLTAYQGVTLASIVEQEVSKPTDRPIVAQVFLKRYHEGVLPLGSDVTAYYGAIRAGVAPALDYDSPYNTLLHKGLPPGPISNVADSAMNAVAHPASTDWLYFVAGDDGNTYFSHTLDEHNANIDKYCHKLCAQTAN